MAATPPQPTHDSAHRSPPYSDEAFEKDVWAVAWLLLDVDATGRVASARFYKRPGYGLDELALAADEAGAAREAHRAEVVLQDRVAAARRFLESPEELKASLMEEGDPVGNSPHLRCRRPGRPRTASASSAPSVGTR